ncbi:MAG: aminomethyl transferase family protein [Halobellus sp.]
MSAENLQQMVDGTDDLVQEFRDRDLEASIWDYPDKPYDFPDEFTHWIREQKAWREQCAVIDQSFHMTHFRVTGDDDEVLDLFETVAVNSFADWRDGEPPQAKQFVALNPDGYVIGDCILFWLEEGHYLFVGEEPTHNWTTYQAEKGDYDVDCEMIYNPLGPRDPEYFRFEIAGPNAIDLMEEAVDGGLPEIPFFQMDELSVQGVDAYALGHQMTSERGIEIFGDYEHHDKVLDHIHEVGEDYGLRQVGNKAYITTGIELAWIPLPLPAVYESPEMEGYREWLPMESMEANFVLGGSYVSDDITDYYATLGGLGYEHIAKFDHDFIGRDALEANDDLLNGERKVTFIFDDEDVLEVWGSLLEEGDTYEYMHLPEMVFHSELSRYDEVLKDGETVGMAKHTDYSYNEREVASLGWIDAEYAEPGTRVTVKWGEPDAAKEQVEPHVMTEIGATVAPAPYMKKDREKAFA